MLGFQKQTPSLLLLVILFVEHVYREDYIFKKLMALDSKKGRGGRALYPTGFVCDRVYVQ